MVTLSSISQLLACKSDEERQANLQNFALESVHHGLVITERNGTDNKIVCCNSPFQQMTGYSHEELSGRDCRILQGADTDAGDRARLSQAIARGDACTVTLKNYRRDGSAFWNEISVNPVRDGENLPQYFVGIQKDVTEHRQLQEREQQLGKMLAQSPNEIYTVGADNFRFLWANDSVISSLGYSLEELTQMTPMDISRDLDQTKIMTLMEPLLDGQQEQVIFKAVNQRKDGSHYPVEVHLRRAVFNAKPGFVAIVLNISQREAAEIELRESHEDLRSMADRLLSIRDEERQRLAREMHDEVAQLLAAAKMDLSLLKSGLVNCSESTTELLSSLENITDRTVTSIRRMISDLRPKALEDAGLFGGIEMLSDEIGRRHKLEVVFSVNGRVSDLPDSLVTPVYRLIQESLNNVAKHAHATKAEVSLARTDHALTVRVNDDGVGLPIGVLPHQTGFGLTGMRERVTLLGGDFSVSGHPGQGTEVVAVLPISHT